MWIIIFLVFCPFIYLIVSIIADSISDRANEIKRKKYYGEEELIHINTYQNNNISYEDIMLIFNTQIKRYKQIYFNIDYKLFNKKNEQNYAWSIKTTKQTFGWGVIYNIRFHFSNGWVYLSFSNNQFMSREKRAREYYSFRYDFGTAEIENTLKTCRDEAKIIWKMNGREPAEYTPFAYIPLSENYRASQEDTTQFDPASFYRNLLGLKLHFSHDELKKSYREAIGKYHPDRYGASTPRDRENAEMLMKQVNEAYENLKKIAV
jgi:curved DNA-binding protein CbpA